MTQDELIAMKERVADVPCHGCRACCLHDRIVLSTMRGDDIGAYQCHLEDGQVFLDRKPNGECIYLTTTGCGIHARRPDICRRFDCRILFLTTPKERRRIRIVENPSMREVYEAGKRRLSTLEGA